MVLKKLELSPSSSKRPVNPLAIFKKLTLRGSIENIWEPQAEALKAWHNEHRAAADVVVHMNTGGGKTLVGLLMAQSLVNEKNGHVLYVCPNNQLVEQINERAKEIGLTPALRYGGDWINKDAYDSAHTFCITNYDTLFNGKSIFQNNSPDALLFDDAHVAENVIRSQFTLRLNREHPAFSKILHLCRKHFTNSSQWSRFADVTSGQHTTVLFVPTFVVWQHADEFRKILLEHDVGDDIETLFVWEHLKEHLNLCCLVADGSGLEITPVVPPISLLSSFKPGVRRIYLTATMPSQTSFARTFGVANPVVIQPSGKSGDAQRLFVFVSGKNDDKQRESATKLVEDRKCCVISPSGNKGKQWLPRVNLYDKHGGQDEINRFSKSKEAEMLGLVARYDGIDLPGEACRILLLDRLPTGENLIDRFIDESIQVETIRTSHTATRVVQAIGVSVRYN